ncbi:hypothetical protein Tco_0252665 [Tanacetum coccineum]
MWVMVQRVMLLEQEQGLSGIREMLLQANLRSFDATTAKTVMKHQQQVQSPWKISLLMIQNFSLSTSDNNVISYDQYLKENQSEVVKNTTSLKEQDVMIMSIIDEMPNQVAKCNAANQENKIVNESLTIELERYKDMVIFLIKDRNLSQQTGKNILILKCETLRLEEESRLKMKEKQVDLIVKQKKVGITPIDYASLNKLYDHFVPQKHLSAEQVFWLPITKIVFEKLPVHPEPVQKDLSRQLPSTSMVKEYFLKTKSHLDNFDKVVKVRTKVTGQNEAIFQQMETEVEQCSVDRKYFEIEKKELLIKNDYLLEQIIYQDIVYTAMHSYYDLVKYADMEKSFIDEYNKCLEHEAEL